MSIKAIESMSSSTSSSSSSISINTVSSLRHQFDNRIDTISLNTNNNNIHSNKPYGSNVNRLRSVFVPQSELAQQNNQKRQKFNNEEDSDDQQQQQFLISNSKTQHVSRSDNTKPTTEDIQTTTTTKTNSNTNRSRSLSTPRITNKQIFIKSNEDYDKIESPSQQPSTTTTLQANTNINNIIDSLKTNTDHLTRFQSAKALFARIEEEAKQAKFIPTTQTVPPSTTTTTTSLNSNSRRSLNFNNSKVSAANRLSTSNAYLYTSLPASTLHTADSNQKRKNILDENKENLKDETPKNDQPIVNYRFNNYLNGLSNEPETKTSSLATTTTQESPAQRRSWTKLQPHSTSPSRRSLPTSTASSSQSSTTTSSSNSPIQQKSTNIDDILNQISSSKLLTNNSNASTPSTVPSSTSSTPQLADFIITNTTPYTVESNSSPDDKKSPVTPPSTPINSLKNDLINTVTYIDDDMLMTNGRRKLFNEDVIV
jgi:hypothetical protein